MCGVEALKNLCKICYVTNILATKKQVPPSVQAADFKGYSHWKIYIKKILGLEDLLVSYE